MSVGGAMWSSYKTAKPSWHAYYTDKAQEKIFALLLAHTESHCIFNAPGSKQDIQTSSDIKLDFSFFPFFLLSYNTS